MASALRHAHAPMVAVATAQPAAPPAARRFKQLDDSSSSAAEEEEAPALQASVAKKVATGVAPRTIIAWEARTWAQVPAAMCEAVFLVPGWGSAKANKLVDLCPEWAQPIDLVEATAETIEAVAVRLRSEKAGISAAALCKLRNEFCKKHNAAIGAANFDAQDGAPSELQAASRAADAARKRKARQSDSQLRDAEVARRRKARQSVGIDDVNSLSEMPLSALAGRFQGWGGAKIERVRAWGVALTTAEPWTTVGAFANADERLVLRCGREVKGLSVFAIASLWHHVRVELGLDDRGVSQQSVQSSAVALIQQRWQARAMLPAGALEQSFLDDLCATNASMFTFSSQRLRPESLDLAAAGILEAATAAGIMASDAPGMAPRPFTLEDARRLEEWAAQCDTHEDILKYAHLSSEDVSKMLSAVLSARESCEAMVVCAGCGYRSPDEKYTLVVDPYDATRRAALPLERLPPDHWMRVPEGAVELLDRYDPNAAEEDAMLSGNREPREIDIVVNPRSHDALSSVCVRRSAFHHLVRRGDSWFHAAAEAVDANGHHSLCSPCCRRRSASSEQPCYECDGPSAPKHLSAHFVRHNPDFYRADAPPGSFAAGHDLGRTRVAGGLDNVLVDLGDVSTLEQLMLAETRMYHITVKVVSPTEDQGAARVRLKSNTIVFPQHVIVGGSTRVPGPFDGSAALDAALERVQCIFLSDPRAGAQPSSARRSWFPTCVWRPRCS